MSGKLFLQIQLEFIPPEDKKPISIALCGCQLKCQAFPAVMMKERRGSSKMEDYPRERYKTIFVPKKSRTVLGFCGPHPSKYPGGILEKELIDYFESMRLQDGSLPSANYFKASTSIPRM